MTPRPHPLVDPPAPEHVDELARVEREAAEFVSGIGTALDAWNRAVADEVAGAFAGVVARAADSHDRFAAGLPPSEPGDRKAAWNALCAYVRQTGSEVWGEIAGCLQGVASRAALSGRSRTTLESLLEIADGLSESAVVPMNPGLFDPDSDDSAYLAARKRIRRGVRRVGIGLLRVRNVVASPFGGQVATISAPTRIVSLAAHARSQVFGVLRTAVTAEERAVADQIDALAWKLELAADHWSRAVMPALDATDSPPFHAPEREAPTAPPDGKPGKFDAWPEGLRTISDAAEQLANDLRAAVDEAAAIEVVRPSGDLAALNVMQALDRGGTFLLHDPPPLPDEIRLPSAPDRHPGDPFRLVAELATFRSALSEVESSVHRIVTDGVLEPLAAAQDEMRSVLAEVAAEAKRRIDADGSNLEALHGESLPRVERMVREMARPERAEQAFRRSSSYSWTTLTERIDALPERLVLPLQQRTGVRPVAVPLRDVARQAFERELAPRIFALYEPLQRKLVRIWNEGEQVIHIVESAFGAAIEELSSADASDARASAHGLVEDGLRRAAESLTDDFDSLAGPWSAFTQGLHGILLDDWTHLYRAVRVDDYIAKKWLGLRSRLTRRAQSMWEALRRLVDGLWHRARLVGRALKMRAARIVRMGRAAVGASESVASERIRTLDAVTSVSDLYAGLPLIYRKLFSLDALSEPTLSVHRKEDLGALVDSFTRWRSGNGPGLFVAHSQPGSGRTSFLNLAARALADEARIVRLRLPDRVSDEATMTRLVAAALELEPTGSLAELERAVQAAEPQTVLVLVDDLEHAMLQTPGGTRLVEDLFLFFARTDAHVFWCAAIGDLAWRFLERTVPAAAGLAIAHPLAPWDRATMQKVVMERHRRSGMPVEFERPQEPSPLLRQRLNRAKTPEDEQRLLREEFFDALVKASGQDPALALYGWVRTGRFDEDGDVLTMPTFRPLSFAFLSRMDNDRAFTLRAFLVHHTLSPEELSRLFRFSDDRTMANLETLLALGLIESVDEDAPGSYIVPGTRYRLRRLVMQPVRRFLAERHFVY